MTDQLKPMSAAQYRANANRTNSKRPTEVVQLASGSIFELHRPDLQGYLVTGRLPHSLLSEGLKAWKTNKAATEIAQDMGDKETVDALIFMREIVHDCTVTPKFVEFATNDDEIGAADMLPEDFNEIFQWAMGYKGVAGREGLLSFGAGQTRGTAADSPDGAGQRSESESPAEVIEPIQ